MELAEEGTYNWAKAATSIHEILMDPDCPTIFGASVPKPAWLDDPQRFREVSAKVLETTATIDHPGAEAMAWRMHGDSCVRLFEHCSLLRGTWRRHALGASHCAAQGPLWGGCGMALAPGRSLSNPRISTPRHREAARSYRKAAAGMDPRSAAQTLVLAEEADARHASQVSASRTPGHGR